MLCNFDHVYLMTYRGEFDCCMSLSLRPAGQIAHAVHTGVSKAQTRLAVAAAGLGHRAPRANQEFERDCRHERYHLVGLEKPQRSSAAIINWSSVQPARRCLRNQSSPSKWQLASFAAIDRAGTIMFSLGENSVCKMRNGSPVDFYLSCMSGFCFI